MTSTNSLVKLKHFIKKFGNPALESICEKRNVEAKSFGRDSERIKMPKRGG
jgi:hypothetical protein